MSEATIEYKNSPNESTAYAVTEGQKTKVQLVATPAGDLELADNPNVDTGYLVIDGEKHKCALVAEVAGELKLPTSATDDTGYVTTQDGRQHKVKLMANITVEKTKFGVSINNFIGDVDADGNYVAPSELFEINLAGVKNIPQSSFKYFLSGQRKYAFHADEVVSIAGYAFQNAFQIEFIQKADDISITFNSVESINAYAAFQYACQNFISTSPSSGKYSVVFSNLKKIEGDYAFQYFMKSETMDKFNQVFPLLEEISGQGVFDSAFTKKDNGIYNFTNIKKIIGTTLSYGQTTFGSFYQRNTVWNFPSAAEFTGYIWNGNASYPAEIHFAAANQAAIEACDGYANKWGFAGATIYFDL